ncbi:MAG: DNA internalization-related competence protein ComEC/Rec2 [Desulfosalsimonas sp.]|uniref:DNA internalization-related competence protein ComEC/Rec2 n=1 Tax=Desulfosalsimonas sp. TaxID=3073848 RepID=UPI00397047DD
MAGRDLQADHFYRLPLTPLLFAFMAGLIVGRLTALPFLFTGAWVTAATAGFYLTRRLTCQKPARLCPLLLFFALGVVSIASWQIPFFPPPETKPLFDSGYMEICGTITGPPRIESFRTRCVLDQLEISGEKNELYQPAGRIQAAFYGKTPELFPGDRVRFRAIIRMFKNFNNPGGFDYRQYMADKNIWAGVYTSGKRVKKAPPSTQKPGFQNQIHGLRIRLNETIASIGADDAGAVLAALVLGKRHRISPELQEAFNRAGVSHLLAISGLHMGIISVCAFMGFTWIISRFRIFLYTGRAFKIAAMLTLVPVICYAMLSGFSPSTQRAVVMIAIFLTAIARAAPYHRINTLAIAAFIICIIHPPSLFSVSFQLSFAAVSAIFYGIHLFFKPSAGLEKTVPRLIGRIKNFMLISVFAIAGTLPLVMHHFQQASVLGVIANLVLVPWIGFMVVPLGLAGALIFLVSGTLAWWMLTCAHWLLGPAISLIKMIANSPVGAFETFSPTVPEVICAYGLLAGLGLIWRGETPGIRKLAAIGLVPIFLVSAADAGYWIHKRLWHSDLRVTVLDVGQGHASLVEFPGGYTMLIDGGGFSDNSVFDVGARILAPYLRQRKIGTIDTVVLSHPDSDHLNGLLYILNHFQIHEVLSTHISADTSGYKKFQEIIDKKQIFHPPLDRVNAGRKIHGARFEILFPHPDAEIACAPCSGANNCALVVRVRYHGKAILFPGDIEACAEGLVLEQAGEKAEADILIAPHHGSKTSSTSGFLDAVGPETVIIPVREGRYQMPSQSVLNRYENRNIKILRTDRHGAARIRIHEGTLEIRTKQKPRFNQMLNRGHNY